MEKRFRALATSSSRYRCEQLWRMMHGYKAVRGW